QAAPLHLPRHPRSSSHTPLRPAPRAHPPPPSLPTRRSSDLNATPSPVSTKITAMERRWVWVIVSISANDLGNCIAACVASGSTRSEEHTSELQSRSDLVCRLLLEKNILAWLLYPSCVLCCDL